MKDDDNIFPNIILSVERTENERQLKRNEEPFSHVNLNPNRISSLLAPPKNASRTGDSATITTSPLSRSSIVSSASSLYYQKLQKKTLLLDKRLSTIRRIEGDENHDVIIHKERGVRGGQSMRSYLEDIHTDPKEIIVPFSCPQIGIYYDVLLAGTEDIQHKKAFMRAIDQYGALQLNEKLEPSWDPSSRYLTFRLKLKQYYSNESIIPSPPPPLLKCINNQGMYLLQQCPTPPPARNLLNCTGNSFMSNENSDEDDTSSTSSSSSSSSADMFQSNHNNSNFETSMNDSDETELSFGSNKETQNTQMTHVELTSKSQSSKDRTGTENPKAHDNIQDVPEEEEECSHPITQFALEIKADIEKAVATAYCRRRIRQRNISYKQKTSAHKTFSKLNSTSLENKHRDIEIDDLPNLGFVPSQVSNKPLISHIEQQYIVEQAWVSRGSRLATNLTLQEAWDIGKEGCYAKMTKASSSSIIPVVSYLRFLIMDGTADDAFLTYYTGGDNAFRKYHFPEKLGTISWFELQNARWSDSEPSIELISHQHGDPYYYNIVIEGFPIPFYLALMTCVRYNYALKILSRIGRRRYFIRQFEYEEAYLKALQYLLLMNKLLHRLKYDSLMTKSKRSAVDHDDNLSLNPRYYVPTVIKDIENQNNLY